LVQSTKNWVVAEVKVTGSISAKRVGRLARGLSKVGAKTRDEHHEIKGENWVRQQRGNSKTGSLVWGHNGGDSNVFSRGVYLQKRRQRSQGGKEVKEQWLDGYKSFALQGLFLGGRK